MNKKYLSETLFSALMLATTGTFTSCKDYDDDITNLQGQIDAQAGDLESKLSSVESSISSLQSAQSSLTSEIANAKSEAEAAALAAQATAIETAQAELEAAKAELQEAINGNTDLLNAAVAAAETAMQEVIGRITALESFATTTETAMANLQNAAASLESQIKTLSEETKATLTEHGQRLAALETQVAALEAYQESNDAAMGDVNTQIAAILAELGGMSTLEESISEVSKLLEEYKASNDTAVEGLADQAAAIQEDLAAAQEALAAAGVSIAGLDSQIASLQSQLEALSAGQLTQADLEAITSQITESVNAQLEEISKQISEDVSAELDLLSEALGKAVTHVELVNPSMNGEANAVQNYNEMMNLRTAEARVDYTFGKDEAEAAFYEIANPREFKKGEKAFLTDSVVIRVTPTNAVLTAGQISFVNSELGTLDQLVTVESVEPLKGMVTTRGISANGLWKVKIKLNQENYSEEAYNAASKYQYEAGMEEEEIQELANIAYAIAVKDTPEETDRYVTSNYALTLARDYTPQYELKFNVDNEAVTSLRNRFHRAEDDTYVLDENNDLRYDLTWDLDENGKLQEGEGGFLTKIAARENYGYKVNISGKEQFIYWDDVSHNSYDVRNSKAFFSVDPNEDFTVSLDYTDVEMSGIYGFYVVLDANRAVESAPSEINAWNSYVSSISGLNQITTGKEITLNIKNESANGEIIGFRVYAINQDGTLVDPDGKAFYVAVGEISQVEIGQLVYAPTKDADRTTNAVALPDEIVQLLREGNRIDGWTVDEENNPTTNYFFMDGIDSNNDGVIDQINLHCSDSPYWYKDNGTYSATFQIKDPRGVVVKNVKVSFTKTMPAFPAAFSAKANQLDNAGAMVIEINEDNYQNTPVRNLGTAFNGISNAANAIVDGNYSFTCGEDSKIKFNAPDALGTQYGFYFEDNTKEAVAGLIADKPNGKLYDVAVSYTYEGISSESEDNNYVVDAPADKNFKLRLVCGEGLTTEWINVDAKKQPVKVAIKYGVKGEILVAGNMKFMVNGEDVAANTVEIKDCHLVTNGVNDEYFTVTYDATSEKFVCMSRLTENPPLSDVNATLKFTMVDFFGHETVVEYPYITIDVE